jgi:hypothetical protein
VLDISLLVDGDGNVLSRKKTKVKGAGLIKIHFMYVVYFSYSNEYDEKKRYKRSTWQLSDRFVKSIIL